MKIGRRPLLRIASAATLTSLMPTFGSARSGPKREGIRLALCGDVMTGRGIDQVLPHPSDPRLHEDYVKSATTYVEIAEQANGRIAVPVDFSYVWGVALAPLRGADLRVINLETAVTISADPFPKGINYRMHPKNVPCLTAARIDCCVLANNHVLDWGEEGLRETLQTLRRAGIQTAGAGRTQEEAARPAVCPIAKKGRVLVFGLGSPSSGIPASWGAGSNKPGVRLLRSIPKETQRMAEQLRAIRQPNDVVVASVHWGSNWGYDIPKVQRTLAHALIDQAGVDIVHGHSSHHCKGIEVHREKLILYGCGDFLNDYEGIRGHGQYRGDLVVMYCPTIDSIDGRLLSLDMVPLRLRRFRLQRPSARETRWLRDTLDREGNELGTAVDLNEAETLELRWRR